ncbi:ABC transporter permease [Candidatus Chlorohelix sp.]|uniref:ABC transporter permease n=1 Tax=Candidatus Chlorohelix sp. TaxID=3139201 RepID=UPI00304608C1
MASPAVAFETEKRNILAKIFRQLFIPLLGIITALIVGALIIFISGFSPLQAYGGLWKGSFGDLEAINGTLATATPYMFTALAVVFAFRAGLFNIGAEGQIKIGAISAAWVGINVGGLPSFLAIPLTLAGGCLGGALWGAIPGALKAWSGAHEVITTIMLNYIATFITSWLVGADGPMKAPARMSQSDQIGENARIGTIVAGQPLHWGLVIGVTMALTVWFILYKTPLGLEIRTVGANPSAARYAGINLKFILLATMAIAGMLAGMAGSLEVMSSPGFRYRYNAALGSGYGFDSIAIALLAKNNPLAVIAAVILFGALKQGASQMQFDTVAADGRQLPGDLILMIQALVILFVAADQVLRWLYRIKAQSGESVVLTRGWGKAD